MDVRRSFESGEGRAHKDDILALKDASNFRSIMPCFSLPMGAADFSLMEDSDNSETLPVLQLGDAARFAVGSEAPRVTAGLNRSCMESFAGPNNLANVCASSSGGLDSAISGAVTESYTEDGNGDGKVRKGQGYRRLWQMVTKVQRGERLGGGSFEWQDCTVEDLLRIVQQLPANSSAVKAVSPGLVYLDSRAAAALFKALAKSGHGGRAVEIFDYLRSLGDHDELRSLCDVFTYTTMISQCGSHHQLRRALELVAEMRSRAVGLNVHTYSALLNVCLKANELDLALDIYSQMLSDGCTPNLVTYNTLVDIYGKLGRWADAVAVLDLLQQQGIQPETRTCNTIISACNLSRRYMEAIMVYQRMLSLGLKPNATTYVALLTAFARTGQLEATLSLFNTMADHGFERGAHCFVAVLSACEPQGRWNLALQLLQHMQMDGVRPSTACMNSVISACMNGGQPAKGEQVYEEMHTMCKPDGATYNIMAMLYCQLGKCREAMNFMEAMLRGGHTVELSAFDAVIDTAWSSGVLSLQHYAVQLFERARPCGHYTVLVQDKGGSDQGLDVQLTAGPPHVVMLAMMHTLKGLREQLLAGGLLTAKGMVQLIIPTQGQEATLMDQVVAGSLRTLGCPLNGPVAMLSGNGRPSSAGVADTLVYKAAAEPFNNWLSSVNVAVALGSVWMSFDSPTRLDGMQLAVEDAKKEVVCFQTMTVVQALEARTMINTQAVPHMYLMQRPELVQLLLRSAPCLGLRGDVGHDAVMLMDRVMASPMPNNVPTGNVLAAACLVVAAQQEMLDVVTVAKLLQISSPALVVGVSQVQAALGGDCTAFSAIRVLRLFLDRLGHDSSKEERASIRYLAGHAFSILGRAMTSNAFVGCPGSLMAMAILYASRLASGVSPAWPLMLTMLTGMICPSDHLQPFIRAALQLLVEM